MHFFEVMLLKRSFVAISAASKRIFFHPMIRSADAVMFVTPWCTYIAKVLCCPKSCTLDAPINRRPPFRKVAWRKKHSLRSDRRWKSGSASKPKVNNQWFWRRSFQLEMEKLFLILVQIVVIRGYSSGAPRDACSSMKPGLQKSSEGNYQNL